MTEKKVNIIGDLPETTEFIDAFINTFVQGLISFSDGFQFADGPDFIDEGLSWPKAIEGLRVGFPAEARTASIEDIDSIFEAQRNKLLTTQLDPILVNLIVNSLNTFYLIYISIIKSKEDSVKKIED